jgi:hypothetical protein
MLSHVPIEGSSASALHVLLLEGPLEATPRKLVLDLCALH